MKIAIFQQPQLLDLGCLWPPLGTWALISCFQGPLAVRHQRCYGSYGISWLAHVACAGAVPTLAEWEKKESGWETFNFCVLILAAEDVSASYIQAYAGGQFCLVTPWKHLWTVAVAVRPARCKFCATSMKKHEETRNPQIDPVSIGDNYSIQLYYYNTYYRYYTTTECWFVFLFVRSMGKMRYSRTTRKKCIYEVYNICMIIAL